MTTHIEAVDRRTGEAITITGVHPVADLFPRIEGEDFRELVESIRADGLIDPIVLDGQGRILDGRNRCGACQEAGVKPEAVPYGGDDPDKYALTVNLTRRHLTVGARHIITEQGRRLTGTSKRQIALDTPDLAEQRLREAATILDWAPERVPAVLAGEAFSVAYEAAKAKKTEAAERTCRIDRLASASPDLHQLFLEERMSLDDATAALDAREKKAQEEEEKAAAEDRERAKVELERKQRFTKAVAQSLASIHAQLAPDAAEAVATSWDPETADTFRRLPGATERFTVKGIRDAASLLMELGQYVNGLKGKTL